MSGVQSRIQNPIQNIWPPYGAHSQTQVLMNRQLREQPQPTFQLSKTVFLETVLTGVHLVYRLLHLLWTHSPAVLHKNTGLWWFWYWMIPGPLVQQAADENKRWQTQMQTHVSHECIQITSLVYEMSMSAVTSVQHKQQKISVI